MAGTLILKNILTQEERINVIKQLDGGKLFWQLADEHTMVHVGNLMSRLILWFMFSNFT